MRTADFSNFPKQELFIKEVFKTIDGNSKKKEFYYGGAVRGGKTFVCLAIFVMLAQRFPKSRWHVLRNSTPNLEGTTIPSLEKLCPPGGPWIYKRDKGNYRLEFQNGSTIFLKAENITHDPNLAWMDGLETNGIMLEQMDSLDKRVLQKANERLGSWYIKPQPKGIILGTFNPTQNWVKEALYEPFRDGTLKPHQYYLQALPRDNPFVTQDQYKTWDNLDPIHFKTYIEGDWDAFSSEDAYIYTFSDNKHIQEVEHNPNWITYFSFDFNVNPMTCIVAQHNEATEEIHILKEYRLPNSTIYDMCDRVKVDWDLSYIQVTGDPRGTARHSLSKSASLNHFAVIMKEWGLVDRQLALPPYPAPGEEHNTLRMIANSLLSKYPTFKIHPDCKNLITDIKYIAAPKGKREKHKEGENGHLLDAWLYYLYTYFQLWVTNKNN